MHSLDAAAVRTRGAVGDAIIWQEVVAASFAARSCGVASELQQISSRLLLGLLLGCCRAPHLRRSRLCNKLPSVQHSCL